MWINAQLHRHSENASRAECMRTPEAARYLALSKSRERRRLQARGAL